MASSYVSGADRDIGADRRSGPRPRAGLKASPHTLLRVALGLGPEVDDATIEASLAEIARCDDPVARLQAAIDSTLGHWLLLSGQGGAEALLALVAVAPSREA